jgi:hypothetical protein
MVELEDEILSFPRGKYDDLIDAFSYQLDYLVPSQGLAKTKPSEEYMSMGWWVKNHLPKTNASIYEKFFADLH